MKATTIGLITSALLLTAIAPANAAQVAEFYLDKGQCKTVNLDAAKGHKLKARSKTSYKKIKVRTLGYKGSQTVFDKIDRGYWKDYKKLTDYGPGLTKVHTCVIQGSGKFQAFQ